MKLSKDEVKKVAHLARLELTDEEVERLSDQLSAILTYVGQLQGVDVTGVEATAQVTGMENVTRADEVDEWPADQVEAALGEAPEREGKYIKVKRVL